MKEVEGRNQKGVESRISTVSNLPKQKLNNREAKIFSPQPGKGKK